MKLQEQDKDNEPLYSSGRQLSPKEKGNVFSRIGQWCLERLDWAKGDIKHSGTALSGLIEDLRTGKRGFNRHFWKSPYFCIPVITGLFLVGASIYLEQNLPACAVYYDGQEIGFVGSQQQGKMVLARSTISGSLAAFSITVVPGVPTAAIIMFSVAPTLGKSK
jgi:hypothetical protein